jgi:imidazoleglycerol-phosphate dehydratase
MRQCTLERKTLETDIIIKVNLDGKGQSNIDSGIGFLDHMLTAFALHSGIDLAIECKGDLNVDCHHSIEDIGIAFGQAFRKLTKNKEGIERYGFATIPMDEALAFCSIDISGRPYLVYKCEFKGQTLGSMSSQMVKEFFYAFSVNAAVTLHINLLYGENDHHKAEAVFKAFAHAVKGAVRKGDSGIILSSKGIL